MQKNLITKQPSPLTVLPRLGLALFLGVLLSILLTSLLAAASLEDDQASANIAGMLDPNFGTNGIVTTAVGIEDDWIYGLALQNDGKIVVLGETSDGAGHYDPVIARYTTSGALDTSFGANGLVTITFGLYDQASDLAIQDDDKIVVVGRVGSNIFADFAVMRYTISGTLDTSFGSTGVVSTSITPGHDLAKSVAIQEDGKIVVAGESSEGFSLARYTVSGTLDSSFGTGGVVTTSFNVVDVNVSDMAIQNDGKIVIVGDTWDYGAYDFLAARYTISGTPDTSFGAGGIVTTSTTLDGEEFATGVAIQSNGRILLTGDGGNGDALFNSDGLLLCYTTTGELDPTFGAGGIVTTSFGTGVHSAWGVAVQEDDKIVVVGSAYNGNDTDFGIIRYTASGVLDDSFGTGGTTSTDIAAEGEIPFHVVIQQDGKIVVAGDADNGSDDDFAIARYYGSTPHSVFLPLVIKN
jgi:uncharacterized delta-60 repeat protein